MESKKLNPPCARHDWPDALTAPELARYMGPWLGEPTAYALFESGAFPTSKIGRMTVVYAVDFWAWLDGDDLRKRYIRESSVMWEGDNMNEVTIRVPRRPKDIRTFSAK